jgi:AcrR family transcriptional regulator
MTPQQRRRELKVAQILDTAEQLVLRHGVDGLTIHALARALDYTPGALYRYFASKQAIIAELNSRAVRRYHQLFDHVATCAAQVTSASTEQAALLPLVATADAFLRWSGEHPGAFAMISATSADPRSLLAEDEAVHIPHMVALLTALSTAIETASDAGALDVGDSQRRAIGLIFGMIGILQLRKLVRFTDLLTPEPLARGLAGDLFRGWGASAEALASLVDPGAHVVDAALAMMEDRPRR